MREIRRYDSRKLYDTEAKSYVSLDQLATLVRDGEDVRVVDRSGEDVTAQVLTQVILETGRAGTAQLPPAELLHELVRRGGEAWSSGVRKVQDGVDRLVQGSLGQLGPLKRVRQEVDELKQRLAQLETSLGALEKGSSSSPAATKKRRPTRKGKES